MAGDWFLMTQERVNDFADATLDHQFIHIDPEKAAATPFGGTIAHGFLTLSMLVKLSESIHPDPPVDYTGLLMGVNYGLNKVRFINPVPTGAQIRATATTIDVSVKGGSVDETRLMTVEIEVGETRSYRRMDRPVGLRINNSGGNGTPPSNRHRT